MYIRKIPNKTNHQSKRYHYTRKKGKWKPKCPFDSQEDAEEYITHYKMTDYVAYLCPYCSKWHIGTSPDKKES